MHIPRQPTIVVLGMMTTMPVGGVIWQTIHYLVGLQRLGFDVYYYEDHGLHPSMFSDENDMEGTRKAAAFLERMAQRFGFASRWCYHAWHGAEEFFGLEKSAMLRVLKSADAVINLHGGTRILSEHQAGGAFIYLETDPVGPQVELHNKLQATEEFLAQHTAHFTYGENLGATDCKVPLPPDRFRLLPTRQPIVLDFWKTEAGTGGERFTTIANWRQAQRQMTMEGEVYHWSKHHEFLKFIELPQQTTQPFELALSSYASADRKLLEGHGWNVSHALDFSLDPERYRDFIQRSRGEWTVAKDQNVRLRSGWFSDRAATYLAAGRPVVTQETAFSNVLPTGCGLFGFSTLGEIVIAIETINSDYKKHSDGARQIARDYFDHEIVLKRLLAEAGISLPK